MDFAYITDVGKVREKNEDCYYVSKDKRIFIVADGMGGHNAGEIASRYAIKFFVNRFLTLMEECDDEEYVAKHIENAVIFANQKLYEISKSIKSLEGMGTTVSIIFYQNGKCYIGNVGDSRIYFIKEEIRQITTDDSLVEQLLKKGDITKEEAKNHPQKNIITQAVGSDGDIDVQTIIMDYNGEKVVLVSDGLTNLVEDSEIFEVFKSNPLPEACSKLVEIANDRGGHDNITIIAFEDKSVLGGNI